MSGGADSGGAVERSGVGRDEAEVEFSRIVAFSAGVFAIAITLLVLALQIPDNVDDIGQTLRDQGDDLLAYAISFAVIGKFWISHHRFYGVLARFDNTLMGLNLFYLAWIALVPFSSELLGNYSDAADSAIVYATNMAGASLTFTVQAIYANRRGLMRSDAPEEQRRLAGPATFLIGTVFLLSIPLALIDTTIAQLSWIAVMFVGRDVAGRAAHFVR
jgi:uncharacterized membrane protein